MRAIAYLTGSPRMTRIAEPAVRYSPSMDQRDSPRVPMRLRVRPVGGRGALSIRHGEVGLEGASWLADGLPEGEDFELRFSVPGLEGEVSALAELVRVSTCGERSRVHVRFLLIDVRTALALARYLEARARLVPVEQLDSAWRSGELAAQAC